MDCTENILINRALDSTHGWTKTNDVKGQLGRVIAIGNKINCNGEVIENTGIKENLIKITEKYKLNDYELNKIDSQYQVGYELKLLEDEYNNLVENFKQKNTLCKYE